MRLITAPKTVPSRNSSLKKNVPSPFPRVPPFPGGCHPILPIHHNMARNIDSWQHDLIIHMLCSKKRLTTSQMAKLAKCSERSVTNIRKNLRLFGSSRSPPISPGRPSNIAKVMVDALFDHHAEKPGLYVEAMAIFLFDDFNVVPSISSIK